MGLWKKIFREEDFPEEDYWEDLPREDFPGDGFSGDSFQGEDFQRDGFRGNGFQEAFPEEGTAEEGFQEENFSEGDFSDEDFWEENSSGGGFFGRKSSRKKASRKKEKRRKTSGKRSLWNLFSRKKKGEQSSEEDWEQIVYARDDINFGDVEQRSRYIVNCLEQMMEASKEIDLLTGEYALVTSYLTDMEEIEALPEGERTEINRVAHKLSVLEQEVQRHRGRKNRMNDTDYYQMRKQEKEVTEGIRKIREGENYGALIKKDLRRLDGERHAYEFRRAELRTMMSNLRGMAVIFLTALVICVLMLLILQFGFEMNTTVGFILALGAAAIAITVLCVKFMDADRETERVEKTINKLIQLQNKVKIRYVNNSQLLEYLYIKYNTDSADKLEKRWNNYLVEKEERKQFAEAEAKTEYYQKQLVTQLSRYRVNDPDRWIHQVDALLDRREMVEIRHDLILRRQSLRKQMDYNNSVEETARREIMDVAEQYPAYAREIREMVERYNL